MQINLESKAFVIFGLPDSGKSTLANFILNLHGSQALVYDTLAEYGDSPYDCYVPTNRHDVAELENVTRLVMKSRRYKLFFIDELNRYCPTKPNPLPSAIADLNDYRAHYDMSFGGACRRPVQLNQDITELAHFLFIFSLTGKNDITYLNDLSNGLGDTVSRLGKYHFVMVDPERKYQVCNPVSAEYITNKKIART